MSDFAKLLIKFAFLNVRTLQDFTIFRIMFHSIISCDVVHLIIKKIGFKSVAIINAVQFFIRRRD